MIILLQYEVWQFNFVDIFNIIRINKCDKTNLLQSVTGCCYKVRQILQSMVDYYYKVLRVLQSATDFIIKCVRYYKV